MLTRVSIQKNLLITKICWIREIPIVLVIVKIWCKHGFWECNLFIISCLGLFEPPPACSVDDFISLLAITWYNFFLTNWKQVWVKLFSHTTYFQSETWESLSSNDTFLAVFKQSVFPFINLKHWKDLLLNN